ncbi:MAG: hypothetical protein JWR17_3215 [Pseudomonas sp.]|nr:hypothetical protein [Pseudomonas sp.]
MPIEIKAERPEDASETQAIYAPVVADTAISFEEVPALSAIRQSCWTRQETLASPF